MNRIVLVSLARAVVGGLCVLLLCTALFAHAQSEQQILEYSDTLSDSGPLEPSNHTISFVLNRSIGPGSRIEVTPPAGFLVATSSGIGPRNVELLVNGSARVSASAAAPGVDQIDITTGSPGFFQYTLAPDYTIATGSELELRIGNHTTTAVQPTVTFSTSTGTSTTPGDPEPITNAAALGRHDVLIEVYDGGLVASAEPIVFLVEKVAVPNADTTEEVPPFRFNGSPTSTVGGTTLSVEISLETDEFSVCKFDTASGTPYAAMPGTFENTGLIFHTQVVPVTPDSVNPFYVRCIDDEGNFNITDFLIEVTVSETPTGSANEEGDVSGDGSGTGNDGTGEGGGGGGTTGEEDGETPEEGPATGSGGGGGGGGGGSGSDEGDEAGGGFETREAPYRSGDGRVVISGLAFPNADITILVDGQVAEQTTADSSGDYEITIDEIARGAYTFGVYGEDENGVRSSTFSTSFTVSGARTSALSNINILPTILVEPDPVEPGEVLTISGYSLPDAEIRLENGRIDGASETLTTTSDGDGLWSLEIDTAGFSRDTYQVRARAIQSGTRSTRFSDYTFYGVGQEADVPLNTDLNRDGFVNLIDFSILLFWWGGDGGDSDPPADINGDGTVSLTDFSILLFNWTG